MITIKAENIFKAINAIGYPEILGGGLFSGLGFVSGLIVHSELVAFQVLSMIVPSTEAMLKFKLGQVVNKYSFPSPNNHPIKGPVS